MVVAAAAAGVGGDIAAATAAAVGLGEAGGAGEVALKQQVWL